MGIDYNSLANDDTYLTSWKAKSYETVANQKSIAIARGMQDLLAFRIRG